MQDTHPTNEQLDEFRKALKDFIMKNGQHLPVGHVANILLMTAFDLVYYFSATKDMAEEAIDDLISTNKILFRNTEKQGNDKKTEI